MTPQLLRPVRVCAPAILSMSRLALLHQDGADVIGTQRQFDVVVAQSQVVRTYQHGMRQESPST